MIASLSADILTIGIIVFTILVLGRKYIGGGVCRITKDLSNQVVIITGSNTGIGKETAYALAKMKATVILACRDPKRTLPVVQEIKKKTGNSNVEFMQLDLSDLQSIKSFSESFRKKHNSLHILINNAGVLIDYRKTTKDGFEAHFGVNHLGHFYLTNLLLDVIKSSSPSRIINVSSMVHTSCKEINWDDIMYEKNYTVFKAYPQSKLANNIFTNELQRRLNGTNVKVVSLNPGSVKTDVTRHLAEKVYLKVLMFLAAPFLYYSFKTPCEGAQTTLYCALEDHDKLKGGMYYSDCKPRKESPLASNEEIGTKLWDLSEDLISKAINKLSNK